MQGYQAVDFGEVEFSVAMTEDLDRALASHLDKGRRQEDLTFAFWRPSRGRRRYTGILYELMLPEEGDRVLQRNVAFSQQYLKRALRSVPEGSGLALLHSHLGPGWQGMSKDDVRAERERMGGAVAARTGLPVLGLTRGTDGSWSARFWLRTGPNQYARHSAATVRVVGQRLRVTYHPELRPVPSESPAQAATVSVWGQAAQEDLVRAHIGVVGLGSVGGLVGESLGRMGIQRLTLIDHDLIETRNLDRTLGATARDAELETPKVEVARRNLIAGHTAPDFEAEAIPESLLSDRGLHAALDCDVLLAGVDRPLPRHVLNAMAKAHLIPTIDGGILARVNDQGLPVHVDWRIHTVSPGRACLYCLGALRRSDVALDREGRLDDPDYIAGLPAHEREIVSRRNVFAFSMSVAAHQVLQLVGLVAGMPRIGGIGPQHYSAYPGRMTVDPTRPCNDDCDIDALTSEAIDLTGNIL
jgi:hypothetical protein